MAGLFPVISFLEASFRIDEHVGNVLDIAHFQHAAAHFEEWIVGRRRRIGRIEQQYPAEGRTEACGQLPVLALDVVDDRGCRPREQGGDDEPDALTRAGRGEAEHMLGAIVTEVGIVELAQHHSFVAEQSRLGDVAARCPARGPVGFGGCRLAAPPDRHRYGDHDRDKPTRGCDHSARLEHVRCIGIVDKPPPKQVVRSIERVAEHREPWRSQLGLKSQGRGGPLRRSPDTRDDDQGDCQNLAPEDLCCGHRPRSTFNAHFGPQPATRQEKAVGQCSVAGKEVSPRSRSHGTHIWLVGRRGVG